VYLTPVSATEVVIVLWGVVNVAHRGVQGAVAHTTPAGRTIITYAVSAPCICHTVVPITHYRFSYGV
jgi:hypothetical protein